jgi:peptide/nickel transport system permease protein
MSLGAFIARRLALALLVLVGVSIITFVISRVIPADPLAMYVGGHPNKAQIERARDELGLGDPLYYQYMKYVASAAQGDFGTSLRTHRSVMSDILYFLPSSLQMIVLALILATLFGVFLGAFSAHHQRGLLDHSSRLFAIGGVSLPPFWLALLLQLLFFGLLGILPVGGATGPIVAYTHPIERITGFTLIDSLVTGNMVAFWDVCRHLVLPVIALAAFPFGVITRMSRSTMIETLEQDHIRTARALGLPPNSIVFKYALKNSMAPVVTLLGLMFAYCLIGTFFIELVFSYPGLGMYAVNSILALDYPAIMGITLVVAVVYVIANLIVDLVLARLDPRIVLE